MEADEEFSGCISCMGTNDLCDLFGAYAANAESYAKMFENCFNIKLSGDLKYLCTECVEKLEKCVTFKDQTVKNMSMFTREEEYLDESILEEAEKNEKQKETDEMECETADNSEKNSRKAKKVQKVVIIRKQGDKENMKQSDYESNDELDADALDSNGLNENAEQAVMKALDDTQCMYCSISLGSVEEARAHITAVHGMHPNTGQSLASCHACLLPVTDLQDHLNRCHGVKSEQDGREFPCHFCDNIYTTRKACFTHLRMKHGLKLYNDQSIKSVSRERKKCHLCSRDFSQKQILNKHLWKAHGIEVEKRKAFLCPLCTERVSYGSHFSAHLLHQHRLHEQVEQLEFTNMDEFKIYKSAIQDETKYRFRKTTSSKPTIGGLRSHYMCSQSGIYIYQGKGKRPAPERQIYKTGKACPAHMIVTETMERVLVTFYKTHVGHGLCPYYEPRDGKKVKTETVVHHDEINSHHNQQLITYDDNHISSNHVSNNHGSSNHGSNKNHSKNQQHMGYSDNRGMNNHANQQHIAYDNRGMNNQQRITYDNHMVNMNHNNSNQQLIAYSDNQMVNNHSNQYNDNNVMSNQQKHMTYDNSVISNEQQKHMTYDNNVMSNQQKHMTYDNSVMSNQQKHMTYDNSVMSNQQQKHMTYDNSVMSNQQKHMTYDNSVMSNQQKHMTYDNSVMSNQQKHMTYDNHVISNQQVATYDNHVINNQQHIAYNDLFKSEVMNGEDDDDDDDDEDDDDKCVQIESSLAWICDTCGMGFLDVEQFKRHIISHGPKLFPCQFCEAVFENIDAWTRHIQIHGAETIY